MLRVRWLGLVPYGEAHQLQHAIHAHGTDDYLLLQEHPHVFTLGSHADPAHVLVDPATVGATMVRTDRGGDVTYHGPGQLVGYPIVNVPFGSKSTPRHVHSVEQLLIDALWTLGLECYRLPGYPGVWTGKDPERPRKIAAIGVRISKQRSMHGFALNVAPDLGFFEHIVPCGISDKEVTSLKREGIDVAMAEVIDAVVAQSAGVFDAGGDVERQDVSSPATVQDDLEHQNASGRSATGGARMLGRLRQAGVDETSALGLHARKPSWLRVNAHMGGGYLELKKTMRSLELVTVCEEAGCPNIYECWADGTATFMINGDRCTRACGFCLVDTRRPLPVDPQEPDRVARAVERMGLSHTVVTAVARDDLDDGGAGGFVKTIAAIKERCPNTAVEVLIPDCKGSDEALDAIFAARPDVLNHNLETVARLHRAVRPSAKYHRSLTVLARAKDLGLLTKSGLMVGLGETYDEMLGALADLKVVGTEIVTIGQYLRPSPAHLPVQRWWMPSEFEELAVAGRSMGFTHVQASPLTRSSYHARSAANEAQRVRTRFEVSRPA